MDRLFTDDLETYDQVCQLMGGLKELRKACERAGASAELLESIDNTLDPLGHTAALAILADSNLSKQAVGNMDFATMAKLRDGFGEYLETTRAAGSGLDMLLEDAIERIKSEKIKLPADVNLDTLVERTGALLEQDDEEYSSLDYLLDAIEEIQAHRAAARARGGSATKPTSGKK
ncbi:MAG: hypothetical protein SFT92_10190 [Rickettsiales bacterium]|nr:hypothetical protein [Rickettsiales bacterium]